MGLEMLLCYYFYFQIDVFAKGILESPLSIHLRQLRLRGFDAVIDIFLKSAVNLFRYDCILNYISRLLLAMYQPTVPQSSDKRAKPPGYRAIQWNGSRLKWSVGNE